MTPFLLIPGLNCDGRIYAPAATVLWPHGPVTIANHLAGEGVGGIAANILRDAPPLFALAGFSLGGYVAFEILRRAPERVLKLALLDTNQYPDTPESSEVRRRRIALGLGAVWTLALPGIAQAQAVPAPPSREELNVGQPTAQAEANRQRLSVEGDIERGPCPLADPGSVCVTGRVVGRRRPGARMPAFSRPPPGTGGSAAAPERSPSHRRCLERRPRD